MPASETTTSSLGNDALLTGSCCLALATLTPIALCQTGWLPQLPDPPASIVDSERIVSSKMSHPLGVPDTLLGIASSGTTLALIFLARRSVAAKKLLGLKLAADVSAGAFNAGRQVISFGKLCSWCTGTAIATGLMAFAGKSVIAESYASAASLPGSAYEERSRWTKA